MPKASDLAAGLPAQGSILKRVLHIHPAVFCLPFFCLFYPRVQLLFGTQLQSNKHQDLSIVLGSAGNGGGSRDQMAMVTSLCAAA